MEKAIALEQTRDHRKERKARTRRLIELGGLVVKAGLVELTDDDRPVMLGSFYETADRLRGQPGQTRQDARPASLKTVWRSRGQAGLAADAAAKVANHGSTRGRAPALAQARPEPAQKDQGPGPRGPKRS